MSDRKREINLYCRKKGKRGKRNSQFCKRMHKARINHSFAGFQFRERCQEYETRY